MRAAELTVVGSQCHSAGKGSMYGKVCRSGQGSVQCQLHTWMCHSASYNDGTSSVQQVYSSVSTCCDAGLPLERLLCLRHTARLCTRLGQTGTATELTLHTHSITRSPCLLAIFTNPSCNTSGTTQTVSAFSHYSIHLCQYTSLPATCWTQLGLMTLTSLQSPQSHVATLHRCQHQLCPNGQCCSQADLDGIDQVIGQPLQAALHRRPQVALKQVGHHCGRSTDQRPTGVHLQHRNRQL